MCQRILISYYSDNHLKSLYRSLSKNVAYCYNSKPSVYNLTHSSSLGHPRRARMVILQDLAKFLQITFILQDLARYLQITLILQDARSGRLPCKNLTRILQDRRLKILNIKEEFETPNNSKTMLSYDFSPLKGALGSTESSILMITFLILLILSKFFL